MNFGVGLLLRLHGYLQVVQLLPQLVHKSLLRDTAADVLTYVIFPLTSASQLVQKGARPAYPRINAAYA